MRIFKKITHFSKLIVCVSVFCACSSQNPQLINNSALDYFHQGNESYQKRDYSNAIRNYQHAIELDPLTVTFYYNLGLAYYAIGNYGDALQIFIRATQMNPNVEDIYYNMALTYYKLDQIENAQKYYHRYQELTSNKLPQTNTSSESIGSGKNLILSQQ